MTKENGRGLGGSRVSVDGAVKVSSDGGSDGEFGEGLGDSAFAKGLALVKDLLLETGDRLEDLETFSIIDVELRAETDREEHS